MPFSEMPRENKQGSTSEIQNQQSEHTNLDLSRSLSPSKTRADLEIESKGKNTTHKKDRKKRINNLKYSRIDVQNRCDDVMLTESFLSLPPPLQMRGFTLRPRVSFLTQITKNMRDSGKIGTIMA